VDKSFDLEALDRWNVGVMDELALNKVKEMSKKITFSDFIFQYFNTPAPHYCT